MSPDSVRPQDAPRRYRAGETIEDYCRACQADRLHTVMVADANGRPIRDVCGFCGSEHNYRGGPRTASAAVAPSSAGGGAPGVGAAGGGAASGRSQSVPPRAAQPGYAGAMPSVRLDAGGTSHEPLPLVSDRERVAPPVSLDALTSLGSRVTLGPPAVTGATDLASADSPSPASSLSPDDHIMDLELLLRRIIREETGLTPTAPAERWRGGEMVLRAGKPGLQDKTWPIDTFFHKIVMIRNRLRMLEQHLNASDLPDDVKVKLQGYVTGCYGSLTSFNVLFADEDDQFKGTAPGE